MALISVLRETVKPSAVPRYERLIRYIAERARQDGNTFQWSTRINTGATGRTFNFVTPVSGFAALSVREQPDDMIRRLLGEAAGNDVLEQLGEGVLASEYLVSRIREDLSSQAQPLPGESPPLILLTRIRASRDAGLGVEELIRHVGDAATKVGDQRRMLVLQTAIGDLRSYAVAQSIDDAARLDEQPSVPELLLQAYGEEEGHRIFSAGTACIEQVETELSVAAPELSNP